MKDFYTPKEVSEILSVHEKTVRRYLRDGVIKGQKIGGGWKVSKDVLMAYMDERPKQDLDGSITPVKGQEKVRISLRIDIDIKSAREGNKYARMFMDMINSNDYQPCNFQYELDDKVAQYKIGGSVKFVKDALEALEEAGIDFFMK